MVATRLFDLYPYHISIRINRNPRSFFHKMLCNIVLLIYKRTDDKIEKKNSNRWTALVRVLRPDNFHRRIDVYYVITCKIYTHVCCTYRVTAKLLRDIVFISHRLENAANTIQSLCVCVCVCTNHITLTSDIYRSAIQTSPMWSRFLFGPNKLPGRARNTRLEGRRATTRQVRLFQTFILP